MPTDLTPLLAMAKRLRATLARDDDPAAVIQRARAEVLDLIDAIREARFAAGATCSSCSGAGYVMTRGPGTVRGVSRDGQGRLSRRSRVFHEEGSMDKAIESRAFESWAVLELLGHVRMAGRVTEEERFGSKVGRIDVPDEKVCPTCNGDRCIPIGDSGGDDCPGCRSTGWVRGFTTVYFTASSLYRMTPCSEAVARSVAAHNRPEPVHRWELPRPEEAASVLDGTRRRDPFDDRDDDGGYEDEEDEP